MKDQQKSILQLAGMLQEIKKTAGRAYGMHKSLFPTATIQHGKYNKLYNISKELQSELLDGETK